MGRVILTDPFVDLKCLRWDFKNQNYMSSGEYFF